MKKILLRERTFGQLIKFLTLTAFIPNFGAFLIVYAAFLFLS